MQNPKTRPPSSRMIEIERGKGNILKKRIKFIINPRSGIRKNINLEALIDKEIDKDIFDFEIVLLSPVTYFLFQQTARFLIRSRPNVTMFFAEVE